MMRLDWLNLTFESDRDGEMRNRMEEVGGAVERIDDPAMALVGAGMRTAFFAQKTIVGPCFNEFRANDRLGSMIGRADEIARAFHRDLEMLDLAEIALKATAGAVRRLNHDVEDR